MLLFLFYSGFLDSGCESLAVLFEEGVLQSMHYPEHYSNLADCQWIICAPQDHVIKLTYQSFEVEESEDCTYDAVTVYEDVGKEEEIGLAFNFGIHWGPITSMTFSSLLLWCKLKFTSIVSGVAVGTTFSTLEVLACVGSVPLMETKSHLTTVVHI